MDNWVKRVFVLEVGVQCELALMARDEMDNDLKQGGSLRFWYAAQAFLAACANVSKLLWPAEAARKGETEEQKRNRLKRIERGNHLRAALSMAEDSPLKPKKLRNYFEHFDERLDEWVESSPNHILMDRCIGTPGGFVISGMGPKDYMGYLDLDTYTVTFHDLTIPLRPMIAAVEGLRAHIRSTQGW